MNYSVIAGNRIVQPLDDSSRTRSVNFEPGDNVWVCLSPLENVWKQGVIICSVVGVTASFVICG